MPDTLHLLPPNATAFEKALSEAMAKMALCPVPLRALVNADDCPEDLLPWLAWALSVDQWETDWSEEQKRNAVRQATWLHQHKGTRGAVSRALDALGYRVSIKEWWEKSPRTAPGTFSLEVEVDSRGIDSNLYRSLTTTVNHAKNIRSHLAGFDVIAATRGTQHIGVSSIGGISLVVSPYVPESIERQMPIYLGAGSAAYQTITVRSI